MKSVTSKLILLVALGGGWTSIAATQGAKIVHDAEYYILDSAKFSGTLLSFHGSFLGLVQMQIRELDCQVDPSVDERSQTSVVA